MIISGLKETPFFTQNWDFFLLSYKNRYRIIMYIIVNNIFIRINEFWIQ